MTILAIEHVQRAKRAGCWLEDGPVKIHLGVEAEFRPARKAHSALVVDDVAALADRLRVKGRLTAPTFNYRKSLSVRSP